MCSLWTGFFRPAGIGKLPPKKAITLEESAISSMFEIVRSSMVPLFQIELLSREVSLNELSEAGKSRRRLCLASG